MTKERLDQILKEMEENPQAFERDGYKYFIEAVGAITSHISAMEAKKDYEAHKERVVTIVKEDIKKKKKK